MRLPWKTAWRFPVKVNIHLSRDAAILPLGVYSREMKRYVHTKSRAEKLMVALS